jgi:branched-chain amino acid transport system permease protein
VKKLNYLLLAILLIIAPLILTRGVERHLLVMFVIYALLALSLDITFGRICEFSLGNQAFFGLGGFAVAMLTSKLAHLPIWVGLIAGIVVCGLLACFLAAVSLRVRGAYLAITTLGFAMVVQMVFYNIPQISGGAYGIGGIPAPVIGTFSISGEFRFYYFALAFAAIIVYFLHSLYNSRVGRAMIAIGKNEELASSLGISTFKYKLLAFVISSIISGLAGFLYAHYSIVISNSMFGIQYLFAMMVAILVGGIGTLWGPILGALIYIFLPAYLGGAIQTARMRSFYAGWYLSGTGKGMESLDGLDMVKDGYLKKGSKNKLDNGGYIIL